MFDLAEIRARHPLAAIVGASVKLTRAGNELRGCCPFHPDKSPSFYLFDGGDRFHCFGCSASGDVLDYIQRLHQVSLPEAADMLGGGNLPVVQVRVPDAAIDHDKVAAARSIWWNAVPVSGTPAESYLRNRGITIRLPDSLRFARLPLGHRPAMPALVALVTGPDNKFWGVQRTFLTEGGLKAELSEGKVKFSLGKVKGGAVRLAPGAADGLMLCEGVEDGLSLIQMEGRACWAAAGAGMLAGMRLPEAVRSVVIGADADNAGRAAAAKASDAFKAEGRSVRIIYPLDGHKDFNSELQGASA